MIFLLTQKSTPLGKGVDGAWNNFIWNTNGKRNIDLDLGIIYGFDKGIVNENLFDAKSKGFIGRVIFILSKMVITN